MPPIDMKRTTLLAGSLLLAIAALTAACGKSDQAIIQEQYREAANLCPKGCDNPPPGCSIKGNIGSTGLKFYLPPDHPLWQAAIIDPAKGEKWFCNAQEAQANGFQPAPTGN
jgi:hypothetical protein